VGTGSPSTNAAKRGSSKSAGGHSGKRSRLGRLLAIAACVAAPLLAGCQVTPLYADRPAAENTILSTIFIEEVDDRVTQQLRNELIFLFNGGNNQPADPRYRLALEVEKLTMPILRDPQTGEATGQNLELIGRYLLFDAATGAQLLASAERVTTTYDRFEQGFADLRAERDAENRAAKELAQRIRANLAIKLNTGTLRGPAQGA
jgi:LPS-assembly lipoprotein